MRHLVAIAESTIWAHYSSVVFLLFFTGVLWMVYRPSARLRYEDESKIVFDDGKKS
jgi:cbb3-type cytochrome oxidase subunit 3